MNLNAYQLDAAERALCTFSPMTIETDATINLQLVRLAKLDEVDETPAFSFDLQRALLDVTRVTPERLLKLLSAHYDAEATAGERLEDHVSMDRVRAAGWVVSEVGQTIWQTEEFAQQFQALASDAREARDRKDVDALERIAHKIRALEAANAATAQVNA